jgi:hypothetical protein
VKEKWKKFAKSFIIAPLELPLVEKPSLPSTMWVIDITRI